MSDLLARLLTAGTPPELVAEVAMELARAEAAKEAIAIAAMALANVSVRAPTRDEYTSRRDSNKARRGISNQRWQALRAETFERDGYVCVYCGAIDDLTCDHVVPLVRGGTNDNENLATACRPCNASKGDKLLSEWRRL